jgi:hypothetical protein
MPAGTGVFFSYCGVVAMLVVSGAWMSRECGRPLRQSFSLIFGGFLVLYISAVLAVVTAVMIEPLADRYLAPAYLVTVLLFWDTLGGSVVPALARRHRSAGWRNRYIGVTIVFGAAILVWLYTGVAYIGTRIASARDAGVGGVNQPAWLRSETLAWLRSNPLDGAIVSNDPSCIYLLAGQHASYPPAVTEYYGETDRGLRELARRHAEFKVLVESPKGAYLVWLRPHWRTILCDPGQLAAISDCDLVLLQRFADGYVVRLVPRQAQASVDSGGSNL